MFRFLAALALVFAAPLLPASAQAPKIHHVAIQVDSASPATMNLALNNLVNISNAYGKLGEQAQIELVAFGPGLTMLRADTSPVAARVHAIATSIPDVTFSACHNTLETMEKKEGHSIAILPDARMVPSGAVRLIQLQEQGWSYLKP